MNVISVFSDSTNAGDKKSKYISKLKRCKKHRNILENRCFQLNLVKKIVFQFFEFGNGGFIKETNVVYSVSISQPALKL